MPFVAPARRSPTDAVGEYLPEFEAPLPDRLVGYRDAAGGQHLLDHPQAQRFLSTHDQVANVFIRRPDHGTAASLRSGHTQAFAIWADVTGVAMAA